MRRVVTLPDLESLSDTDLEALLKELEQRAERAADTDLIWGAVDIVRAELRARGQRRDGER